MVKRCVTAGCSNTYRDGVSLFKFPKDPQLRKKWTKQVQRTCAEWKGPSDHSVLCSNHFEEACLEPAGEFSKQFGLAKKAKLKPDAVPTVFKRPRATQDDLVPTTSGYQRLKKTRVAYEKRERARVSFIVCVVFHNDLRAWNDSWWIMP